MLTELIAATQVEPELNGNGNGARRPGREAEPRRKRRISASTSRSEPDELELPERAPAARTRARAGATASATRPRPGKTIAAAGFVEAARTLGVLILTHRRLLVSQFHRELTTEGYGDRFEDAILQGQEAAAAEPGHRSRRTPGSRATDGDLDPRGVPARDLPTRRTRRSARRRARRSAASPTRSTSA